METAIKTVLDRKSVVLVEIGITMLSGSKPLLNETMEMMKTTNIKIGIKISPEIVLIRIKVIAFNSITPERYKSPSFKIAISG